MSKVLASTRNNALSVVNNTRRKWGLSTVGSNLSTDTRIEAKSGVNDLLAWLREAKNKSGSPTAIISDVPVATVIRNVYTDIESAANTIYNYCACHGNCSSSCRNSCTGGCSDRCRGCGSSCSSCHCGTCGGCMTT